MKPPLEQLRDHIQAQQEKHRALKPQIDAITKELAALGFKPDDSLDLKPLPIDEAFIEQAKEALNDGGKNVKGLQKALNLFDYAELTRKRKALLAAGVTKETENYQGTNATIIELNDEAPRESTDEPSTTGDETAAGDEEATTVGPESAKPSAKAKGR